MTIRTGRTRRSWKRSRQPGTKTRITDRYRPFEKNQTAQRQKRRFQWNRLFYALRRRTERAPGKENISTGDERAVLDPHALPLLEWRRLVIGEVTRLAVFHVYAHRIAGRAAQM